jgi:hypothetical protein
MTDRALAEVTDVSAYLVPGMSNPSMARTAMIVVKGKRATPCHQIDVVPAASTTMEPIFAVVSMEAPGFCIPEESEFTYMEEIPFTHGGDTIRVISIGKTPSEPREWTVKILPLAPSSLRKSSYPGGAPSALSQTPVVIPNSIPALTRVGAVEANHKEPQAELVARFDALGTELRARASAHHAYGVAVSFLFVVNFTLHCNGRQFDGNAGGLTVPFASYLNGHIYTDSIDYLTSAGNKGFSLVATPNYFQMTFFEPFTAQPLGVFHCGAIGTIAGGGLGGGVWK